MTLWDLELLLKRICMCRRDEIFLNLLTVVQSSLRGRCLTIGNRLLE